MARIRKGARGRRGQNSHTFLYGLIAVCLTAVAVMAMRPGSLPQMSLPVSPATVARLVTTPPKPCTPGFEAPENVTFLVDATDRLTADEVSHFRRMLWQMVDLLPAGSLVNLVALKADGTGSRLGILFEDCKPRDGSDASSLTENAEMMGKAYQTAFVAPLNKAIQTFGAAGNAPTSPIIRGIQQVTSLAVFAPSTAQRRALVVVSDLIENSSLLSMYRGGYSWRDVKNALWITTMEDRLEDVAVTVFLRSHPRIRRAQGPRHENFWRGFFAHAGVKDLKLRPF